MSFSPRPFDQESISPTFKERICTNIIAQMKSLTFTARTKKFTAKHLYKKKHGHNDGEIDPRHFVHKLKQQPYFTFILS